MQNRAVIFESRRGAYLSHSNRIQREHRRISRHTKRRIHSRRTAERVGFSASSVTVESPDAPSTSDVNSESAPTTVDVSTGADELKTLRSLPLILFSVRYIFLRATRCNLPPWRCKDSLRKKKARQSP